MAYEPAPGIRPIAPAPSLLTAARPLPTLNWSTGIQWPTHCQVSYALPYCPPAVDRTPSDDATMAHTMPFLIYTPMSCFLPVDAAYVEQQTTDLEETHTAHGLARALWLGEGLPSDTDDNACPTLRRAAMDVSGAGAYQLDDGVAQLLVHYEECTGGEGGAVVHLPSELAVYALGGGAGGARLCWPEGNIYRGATGAVFVTGPGYPNGRSPHGPFGNGPQIGHNNYQGNEDGTAWIYVTGPVEYAVTPIRVLPETERDRVAPRTNIYDVWGERNAIVRFDPCCCFATEVVNPAPMPEVS